MDEQRYFLGQEQKSPAKIAWEYGQLLRLAGLSTLQARRVLDAGCGAGPGLRFFVSQGSHVVGIDRSAYALRRARQAAPQALLLLADLDEGLPLASSSFDLIVLGDVLEHIAAGERLLRECFRLLRPGGALLLRTVNRWDLRRLWQGRRWSGIADPTHRHLYSPPELHRALRRAGFRRVRVRAGAKPIWWLPVRWAIGVPWPPYVGNGLIAAAFRQEVPT